MNVEWWFWWRVRVHFTLDIPFPESRGRDVTGTEFDYKFTELHIRHPVNRKCNLHPSIWYWGNMQIIKDLFNYIQLFLTFLRKTRVPNVAEQKWTRTGVGKNVNGSSSWCSGRGQKTASSDVGREGDKGRRTEARPGRASVHCVQHSQTTILDGKKVTNSPWKNEY